jgi:hypothetical protein
LGKYSKKMNILKQIHLSTKKQQATASADILDEADEGQNIKINGVAQ